MMNRKVFWILGIFIIGFAAIFFFNNQDTKSNIPTIGVIQIVDHPALDQTRKGIQDQLAKDGFIASKNYKWLYESAQGNTSLGMQIAQKFVGQRVNVAVAIGTPVSQSMKQAITHNKSRIPMVFASVTDPKVAGLGSIGTTSPYITGISNFVPAEKQFTYFQSILPELMTIGVIYNPGEANSAFLVANMQKAAQAKGIELKFAPASRTNDVLDAAKQLVADVDAIFINNDNTALAAFTAIVKVANAAKIPVLSSDLATLEKGAFAAYGPDQYAIGLQVGKIVVEILNNPNHKNTSPISLPKKIHGNVNARQAKKLNIVLPLHHTEVEKELDK